MWRRTKYPASFMSLVLCLGMQFGLWFLFSSGEPILGHLYFWSSSYRFQDFCLGTVSNQCLFTAHFILILIQCFFSSSFFFSPAPLSSSCFFLLCRFLLCLYLFLLCLLFFHNIVWLFITLSSLSCHNICTIVLSSIHILIVLQMEIFLWYLVQYPARGKTRNNAVITP